MKELCSTAIPDLDYDDPVEDKDQDKDSDFKSPNSKKSISDSEISYNKSSLFISPTQSKSSFSKQEMSLYMPSFDEVESFDVWSGEYAYLGTGRCGKVFMGTVNGKKVAVKVTIFILLLFLIIKYVIYRFIII